MKQYNHEVITFTTFKRNFSFNKNIKEIVSKNIKKYRLYAVLTQEQLAVDIGKSYDFVRRLEYLLCHDTFSFAIANESDDRLL